MKGTSARYINGALAFVSALICLTLIATNLNAWSLSVAFPFKIFALAPAFFGFIYSPISTCFIGGDWVCSARAINNIVAYRCDEKYLELGKINAG